MNRIFFDTEFIEDGNTIDLISIGMVKENGEELYLVSSEFDESKADSWVVDNVISKLDVDQRYPNYQIRDKVLEFIGADKPEFWAYYADYDWVVFCRLFGRMMDLPNHFPKYCNDIKQLTRNLKFDTHTIQQENEHNALDDAKWNLAVFRAANKLDAIYMDIEGVKYFSDPIYRVEYGVIVLNEYEAKHVQKVTGQSEFGAYYDTEESIFVFAQSNSAGMIAHECLHAIEQELIIKRGVAMNPGTYNEHLSYYIDWLVNNVTDRVREFNKEKEL